jgi:hypothetical protein
LRGTDLTIAAGATLAAEQIGGGDGLTKSGRVAGLLWYRAARKPRGRGAVAGDPAPRRREPTRMTHLCHSTIVCSDAQRRSYATVC